MEIALAVPDMIGRLERRMVAQLAEEAHDWSLCLNALSKWEDEHLLDEPTPELLATHKQTVEGLLRLGRLLSRATSHPDFPDRKTAEMVEATQWTLQQMRDAWHSPKTLSKEQAVGILAAAFPDEP